MQLEAFPFVGLLSVIWVAFIISLFAALRVVLRWGLTPRNDDETVFHALAFLALILVTSLAVLWITPYDASNLGISDSVEYSVGAERMLHEGSYSLSIEGRTYPPRYAPWFSALFIAPAMILTGVTLGNAIWPVLLCGLLGVACAFCVGRRLSGTWGGILAAFTLLLDPGFRYFSKFPMTDVPAAVLTLIVLAYCLVERSAKDARNLSFVPIGVLCSILVSLRMTAAVILLPTLVCAFFSPTKKDKVKRVVAILAPVSFMYAMQVVYQTVTFGAPFRNGYEFWVPWPYEVLSQVFAARYLLENLQTLVLHTPILMFAVLFLAGWPVLKEKKEAAFLERGSFFLFFRLVVWFTIPLVLLYLFYFYSASRFYLPMSVALYVLLGSFIGAFLGEIENHRIAALVCLLVIAAGAAGWRSSANVEPPARRIAADLMARHTPANALIITGIDPAYLDLLVLRRTQRTVLPVSRRVEYASKMVAWLPLSFAQPYPADVTGVSREYLFKSGAQDVVESVALDNEPVILDALQAGRPVFIETSALKESELEALTKRYIMLEVAKNLFSITRVWNGTS